MAEPITWRDVVFLEPSVVNGYAFGIVDLRVRLWLGDDIWLSVVRDIACNRVGQSSGRVHVAIQNIDKRVTELLTTKIGPNNCCDIWMIDP